MEICPVHLVLRRHKHLTCDWPGWMTEANVLWLPFVLIVAYQRGMSSSIFDWTGAMLGFLVISLSLRSCLRWWLRRNGILSSPNRSRVPDTTLEDVGEASLVCYGDPVELARIQGMNDHRFEPVIVPSTRIGRDKSEWMVVAAAAVALLISTEFYSFNYPMTILMVLTASVGAMLIGRVYARYYRIVPGRLDILDYGPLRARVRSRHSVSLRGASVVCRFDRRTLAVEALDITSASDTENHGNPAEQPQRVTVDLMTVASPHALAEGVFRGAICQHTAAGLPDDELVG